VFAVSLNGERKIRHLQGTAEVSNVGSKIQYSGFPVPCFFH